MLQLLTSVSRIALKNMETSQPEAAQISVNEIFYCVFISILHIHTLAFRAFLGTGPDVLKSVCV